MKLYNEGKLAEAERLFAKIDRQKVHSDASAASGDPMSRGFSAGSFGTSFGGNRNDTLQPGLFSPRRRKHAPWGERVLYFLAESQYRQGKLTEANDTYAKLATTYPGTQFMEKVAAREYAIATEWLEAADPKSPPEKREQWGDRFNGRLPVVDVKGHALQVLEHVRHHDPLGPLADDAVMRIADYYYNQGNFEEASIYYDQLISDHPKSSLMLQAHVRSIDAKLKGYVGPHYDTDGLEKARALIGRTMAAFPERDAATSEFLSHSLDLINDQQAEVTYRHGEFYRQTGYPGAAELSFAEVRVRWPQSQWSARSKEQLELIAKAPRKEVLPSKIMTTPGSPDPYNMGSSMGSMMSSGAGMGGMGMGSMGAGSFNGPS